ncbi:MAG: response regulator transcription factor [bacterium]
MDKIKLIIVEDHALTRIGLKTTLEQSPILNVIDEAESGEEGVKKTLELEPDVVIMDLGLPGINGIEATKQIKEYNSEIKVIILTSHDNDREVIAALSAGANAYCMKDISPKKLISIVEAVADGGAWLDPAIARIVLTKAVNCIEVEEPIGKVKQLSPLTDREIEILQLLADGLGNIEVAKELALSQYTVKSHICNILQKLSVDDRTQAVAKAMRSGWIN